MRMLHQLRFGDRARSEIKQQRVASGGWTIGCERHSVRAGPRGNASRPLWLSTDTRVRASQLMKLRCVDRRRDYMAHVARAPYGGVDLQWSEGGSRNHRRAEFHGCQEHLPERHLVPENHQIIVVPAVSMTSPSAAKARPQPGVLGHGRSSDTWL
jgi:hypothetical protein